MDFDSVKHRFVAQLLCLLNWVVGSTRSARPRILLLTLLLLALSGLHVLCITTDAGFPTTNCIASAQFIFSLATTFQASLTWRYLGKVAMRHCGLPCNLHILA